MREWLVFLSTIEQAICSRNFWGNCHLKAWAGCKYCIGDDLTINGAVDSTVFKQVDVGTVIKKAVGAIVVGGRTKALRIVALRLIHLALDLVRWAIGSVCIGTLVADPGACTIGGWASWA